MGEDAQLHTSDADRSLSPVVDGTIRCEDWPDQWICSIDGSYAVDKERIRYEQENLPLYSEHRLMQQVTVRNAVSKDSLATPSGIVLDDGQTQNYLPKKHHSINRGNEFSSIVKLPHSVEIPMNNERLHTRTSNNHQTGQDRLYLDVSTVRRPAGVQEHRKPTSRTTEIYDPLRRIISQTSIPNDDGFSSELQAQGDKLMNGLKAILNKRLMQEKFAQPLPSCALDTMTRALSRVESASTISTGRDMLTREVRRLEDAFACINLSTEASRARAGGESCPQVRRDCTNPGTFNTPDMISQERPCSGSNGTSTVEQARLSSRGSVQILTETAIRDAEDSSSVLRRLRGASSQLSTKVLREQCTNTSKGPVRHFVITHRVKHACCCLGRNRMHNESFSSQLKPSYHPFKLRSTVNDSQQVFDVEAVGDSGKCLDTHKPDFDGGTIRSSNSELGWKNSGRHVGHFCRKTGGGKRGRPIVVGRTLYGRGRVHFRPVGRHNDLSKRKNAIAVSSAVQTSDVLQYAATPTEQVDVLTALETNPECVAQNEIDRDEVECLLPEKPKHKYIHTKVPFVGSGLKCSNTFSVAGNQQQVMKIVSIRFQEWLPLVRSIIYDSQCKDYAQALLRDLRRRKRSNLEQIRILERDLDCCKVDSERREICGDITRLKQYWTRKHEQVLQCLTEHISKGGVLSRVQQLRTIYGACAY